VTAAAEAADSSVPISAARHAERLVRAAELRGVFTSITRLSADVVRVLAIADNGDRLAVTYTETHGNPSGRHTCTQAAATTAAEAPGRAPEPLRASKVISWIYDHATIPPGPIQRRRA
jgi:hypothetical protein